MAKRHTKKLLVEGRRDKFTIPFLMDKHIDGGWGNNADEWKVMIKDYDGVENLLVSGEIRTQLKSSESKYLGIVVDADDQCQSRWQKIRNECIEIFPDIPVDLPREGLCIVNQSGNHLGVWIMPDNQSQGMFETFLRILLPASTNPRLWNYAIECSQKAQDYGATYHNTHIDKVNIYTWLAWQNPPGETPKEALRDNILDAASPKCRPFVNWFKGVFEV